VVLQEIHYRPIGVIHSPFKQPNGAPIQPRAAEGVKGTVELFDEFKEGLADLDGFSHVILIYHFHLSQGYALKVKPFLDDSPRGLFATRAPRRPNAIGVSVVPLERIDGATLYISNVDIVDGTPLLDIKPYVPEFDRQTDIRVGWLTGKSGRIQKTRSDDRFE
jgi:tRNA-Thr(GGU) m(6)t(6)A37 methyltransferase TsaA